MTNTFYNALLEWHRTTDDRQKTQDAFLAITLASLVIAGLVSLVDVGVGKDILYVTAGAFIIFLLNAIIWALLDSMILAKLGGRHKK